MSIQITITGANAAETVQLVQDLAGTMHTINPADIPAKTEVSTVQGAPAGQAPVTPTPAQYAPPVQPAAPAAPAVPVQNGAPTSATPTAPAPTVPTSAPTYTLEQLSVAATPLLDAGRGAELTALLNQFGVQAMTQLPKEQYGAFATALRQMGAQI